jgi:hypothetical protein
MGGKCAVAPSLSDWIWVGGFVFKGKRRKSVGLKSAHSTDFRQQDCATPVAPSARGALSHCNVTKRGYAPWAQLELSGPNLAAFVLMVLPGEHTPFSQAVRLQAISCAGKIVCVTQWLVFPARVELQQFSINVNGRATPLTAGLAAIAEIRTGRRRIIEFLLSPLQRRVEEAGRER